jgi:hypothetical protein
VYPAHLVCRLVPAVLLLCGACAGSSARWDVPRGAEQRFAEARRECHQLTSPSQERFEDCMGRRGFERESFWQRGWRGLTGR